MANVHQFDAKRPRLDDQVEDLKLARDTLVPMHPGPSPKTYGGAQIGGSGSVIVGDNYGSLVNQHYHVSTPRKTKFEALFDSLAFDYMDARFRNVDSALSTTCKWLRDHEHFVSWLSNEQSGGFLWIKGKPGSGKSTIMRDTLLWMKRERPLQIVISHFFDARSPNQLAKSTLGMYRSLLIQLLLSYPMIHRFFMERFHTKELNGKVERWTETEIQNFLEDFLDSFSTSKHAPSLTIFIDALDEDEDEYVQQMVAFLEELHRRAEFCGAKLRICLSSRHYPHISIQGKSITLEEQPGHERDIEEYVRTRLLGGNGSQTDQIRKLLLEKASGVFLWVVLMIPLLNKRFNRGGGLAAMTTEIGRAPRQIDDLFSEIVRKDEVDLQQCVCLLRWMLFARRSLSPAELCCAIQVNESIEDQDNVPSTQDEISRYLLYHSRGLVEITRSSQVSVQFIHETVRESLMKANILTPDVTTRCDTEGGSPSLQTQPCHASISESCLKYLIRVSTEAPRLTLNLSGIDEYPLARYAAEFWWQHMHLAGRHQDSLINLMHSFLSSNDCRLLWTKLYNIDRFYPSSSPTSSIGMSEHDKWDLIHRAPFSKDEAELRTTQSSNRSAGSPLYYALMLNVPKLIQCYSISIVDMENDSVHIPLVAAVKLGDAQVVQLLLDKGIGTDTIALREAFSMASRGRHVNIIKVLLERSNLTDLGVIDESVMRLVARKGDSDTIQLLLQRRFNTDHSTLISNSLIEAVSYGHEEVVHVLLNHGADVNWEARHLKPLETAILHNRWKIAKLLYERGAEFGSRGPSSMHMRDQLQKYLNGEKVK